MEDTPPADGARQLHVGEDAAPASAALGDRKPNVAYLISPTMAGVWDTKGRFFEVRKLGPMDRLDLAVILGPDKTANPQVQGYTALAFSVAKIDGEAIFPAASYNELRGLVGRLGDEGLNAVAETADLLNPPTDKLSEDEVRDRAGNS